jgi:hypothetical protein
MDLHAQRCRLPDIHARRVAKLLPGSRAWLCAIACSTACAAGPARSVADSSAAAIRVPVRTGDVHDFDFLAGAWTVRSRALRPGADGRLGWVTDAAATCMSIHLGGVVNVDEYQFPSRGYSAMALRVFHLEKRQWSIYWIESRAGQLLPPVMGGFQGARGEFYGMDDMGGRPALFRFVWTRLDEKRARWEQAYSRDGKQWTINWVMDFTRARGTECPRSAMGVDDQPLTRSGAASGSAASTASTSASMSAGVVS